MASTYEILTQSQIDHFIDRGHVVVEQAFPRQLAAEWVELAYRRLGCAPDDPASWPEERVHMPGMNRVSISEVAPRVWGAICDLIGGPQRCATAEPSWSDGFIVNFSLGADKPWQPPSPQAGGWHKDGDFFRHFLDSPEQGLLTIVVWSDIEPQSGGTFVACDSVRPVARRLYEHPEGLPPSGFGELVQECRDFVEITGRAGDVVLLHPFVLHAASQNPSGRPRFITNPPVGLKEPMDFCGGAACAPVERAVLAGLGLERLDFRISGERQRLVPKRVERQRQMLAQQQARLAAQ
ncbi:MAG: hypothetical protein GKR89_14370 [Candidatus Latescibacteria bacterium]|nr:hypothetical protein [Candidatus Latescibacterota bacterium]